MEGGVSLVAIEKYQVQGGCVPLTRIIKGGHQESSLLGSMVTSEPKSIEKERKIIKKGQAREKIKQRKLLRCE